MRKLLHVRTIGRTQLFLLGRVSGGKEPVTLTLTW
jgi:hypothetical protein